MIFHITIIFQSVSSTGIREHATGRTGPRIPDQEAKLIGLLNVKVI